MLSDDIKALREEFMNAYENNMGGFVMTATDFQNIIDRLYTIHTKAVDLEDRVPPPSTPIDEGDGKIVQLGSWKQNKQLKRSS